MHPDTKSAARRTPDIASAGGALQPDEYIETRVRQYQDWYDPGEQLEEPLPADRGASVVGAAIVPALINVSFTGRTRS